MDDHSPGPVAEAMESVGEAMLSVSLVDAIRRLTRPSAPAWIVITAIAAFPLLLDVGLQIFDQGWAWPETSYIALLGVYSAYVMVGLRSGLDAFERLGGSIDELLGRSNDSKERIASLIEDITRPTMEYVLCMIGAAVGAGLVAAASLTTNAIDFNPAWYVAIFLAFLFASDAMLWQIRFDVLLGKLSTEPRFVLGTYLPVRTKPLRDIRRFAAMVVFLSGLGVLFAELLFAWATASVEGYDPIVLVVLGIAFIGLLLMGAGVVVPQVCLDRIVSRERDHLLDRLDPATLASMPQVRKQDFEVTLERYKALADTPTSTTGASNFLRYGAGLLAPVVPTFYAVVVKGLGLEP